MYVQLHIPYIPFTYSAVRKRHKKEEHCLSKTILLLLLYVQIYWVLHSLTLYTLQSTLSSFHMMIISGEKEIYNYSNHSSSE